jgi:hypothetical protein
MTVVEYIRCISQRFACVSSPVYAFSYTLVRGVTKSKHSTWSERAGLVENKTDNKYYYDGGRIPMDGQIFVLDTDIIKE